VFDGGAGADLIDGGIGFDTLVFWSATAGVAMSLVTGGTGGDAEGDVYVSVENIYGTAFNDFLEGNDFPNTILGMGGDNVIRGLGGNDWLSGGAGSDTFYPGEGNDRVFGGAAIASAPSVPVRWSAKLEPMDDFDVLQKIAARPDHDADRGVVVTDVIDATATTPSLAGPAETSSTRARGSIS
jgi:hypothetical protein